MLVEKGGSSGIWMPEGSEKQVGNWVCHAEVGPSIFNSSCCGGRFPEAGNPITWFPLRHWSPVPSGFLRALTSPTF